MHHIAHRLWEYNHGERATRSRIRRSCCAASPFRRVRGASAVPKPPAPHQGRPRRTKAARAAPMASVPHAVRRMDACVGALAGGPSDATLAASAELDRARARPPRLRGGGGGAAAEAHTLAALDAEVGAAAAALARAEASDAHAVHLSRAWGLARRALLARAPIPRARRARPHAEGDDRGEAGTVVQVGACDLLVDVAGELVVVDRELCDPDWGAAASPPRLAA